MFRVSSFLLFCVSLFVGLASFYFQYVMHYTPCPLCLMQRICVLGLIAICFWGVMKKSSTPSLWLLTAYAVFVGFGLYFSSRQVWLQSLPPEQMPACLPDLTILMKYFSMKSVLEALFLGAGDCGQVTWSWLGLSMAGWSLFYFVGMAIGGILIMFIKWVVRV